MQTLVYVDGLGDDEAAWTLLRGELRLPDVDHLAYAIPGFGGRAWSGEHVEDIAEDLTNYINRLSNPVVIVGHSLGGAIGTVVAETQPQNLAGFVNIEGNLTPADCEISGAAVSAEDFESWFDSFVEQCQIVMPVHLFVQIAVPSVCWPRTWCD